MNLQDPFRDRVVWLSMRTTTRNSGITLIEILLVISIIAILAAASSPFLSSFIMRNNHDVTLNRVLGSLRKAQTYSMTLKNDAVWGVCETSGVLRLYRGSCGSPDYSEDYELPSVVSVTGLNDTTFSFGRGEPSVTSSISISSSLDSDTIVINEAGGIQLQ